MHTLTPPDQTTNQEPQNRPVSENAHVPQTAASSQTAPVSQTESVNQYFAQPSQNTEQTTAQETQISQPPQPQTPATPQPQTPETLHSPTITNNLGHQEESQQKPAIIKIISMLFIFITILYTVSALNFDFVIFAFDMVLAKVGATGSLLKSFPMLGLMPAYLSIAAVIFLTAGLKIKLRTKSSFGFGLASLFLLPLTIVIGNFSLNNFIEYTQATAKTSAVEYPAGIPKYATPRFTQPAFILGVFALILLLFTASKFNETHRKLATKNKKILIIFSLLLILPTIFVLGSSYFRASDNDYGYQQAEQSTAFHVYRPTALPDGIEIINKYSTGNNFAGQNTGVRLALDRPFNEMAASQSTKTTVINQVGISSNFNVREYVVNEIADGQQPKTVQLSLADNSLAYTVQRPLGNTYLNSITFKTKDDVLISLISPRASLQELLEIAGSLK